METTPTKRKPGRPKGTNGFPIEGVRKGGKMTSRETRLFRAKLSKLLVQNTSRQEMYDRWPELSPRTIDRHIGEIYKECNRAILDAAELRGQQVIQLRELIGAAVGRAMFHVKDDPDLSMKSSDAAVRAMARLAKLSGLDSPDKLEQHVSGATVVRVKG